MTAPIAHVAGSFVPLEVIPLTVAGVLYWHRAMVLSWDGRPGPALAPGLLRRRAGD